MKFIFSMILVFFLVGCTSSASWAFQFIKYNGVHYAVTDEEVESNKLGEKLGEVEHYLSEEQNSKELSSNVYSEGTEFFEIKGISSSDSIAVKDGNGKIIKLNAEE